MLIRSNLAGVARILVVGGSPDPPASPTESGHHELSSLPGRGTSAADDSRHAVDAQHIGRLAVEAQEAALDLAVGQLEKQVVKLADLELAAYAFLRHGGLCLFQR